MITKKIRNYGHGSEQQGAKKFTEQEKLSIFKEAENEGVKKTLDKYGLYPATFYYWKRKYAKTNAGGAK